MKGIYTVHKGPASIVGHGSYRLEGSWVPRLGAYSVTREQRDKCERPEENGSGEGSKLKLIRSEQSLALVRGTHGKIDARPAHSSDSARAVRKQGLMYMAVSARRRP
jgi:hypothetical protein